MGDFLIQVCILILLPIIPAALIFKLFRTHGKGEGQLFGFRWSFGGAFAGYLIILLVLWSVMYNQFNPKDAEVWTVNGKVEPGSIGNIANRIEIRSIPQSLRLDEDGGYEFKIIVTRNGDELVFPRVKIDLSRLCGGVRTVQLDESKGTFGVIPSAKSVRIDKEPRTRSIYISPITVPPLASGELCGSES
jgi:hypothetical protein